MQHEPKWWRWFGAVALMAGLLVRSWPWLSQPLLALEDGALFFATNYAEFELLAVTKPYGGYVPVGSNVLALLVCRLPTDWIPTAFVMTAVFMMFGCAATLMRPAWSAVASFRVRALIAAALVMAPFGSNLEFTSLAYAQWPQMLWLFLLLLEPPAESSRRTPLMILRAIWVVFLTLTNPLSVVLLPLGLSQRVRRTGRLDWVCLVGAVLGYWLVMLLLPVEHIAPTFAAVWTEIVPAIGVNVVVEAFVGVGGANALASAGPLVLASIATLLCGGLVAVVRLALAAVVECGSSAGGCLRLAAGSDGRQQLGGAPWLDDGVSNIVYATLGLDGLRSGSLAPWPSQPYGVFGSRCCW